MLKKKKKEKTGIATPFSGARGRQDKCTPAARNAQHPMCTQHAQLFRKADHLFWCLKRVKASSFENLVRNIPMGPAGTLLGNLAPVMGAE